MIQVLDLFAGIGGFSLGLHRAGDFTTAAFCEIDPDRQTDLARNFPGVPIYGDVRELSAERLAADGIAVDAITAGFPCQDISFAGRGAGLAGERSGLFYEVARLAGELGPDFIILENVGALLSRGLDAVLGTLASLGYDAEWHCIPASYVGAPHRRDRVWIIAYRQADPLSSNPHGIGSHNPPLHLHRSLELQHEQIGEFGPMGWWSSEPNVDRMVDGLPSELDVSRIKGLGNAVVPQIVEFIGRAIIDQGGLRNGQ